MKPSEPHGGQLERKKKCTSDTKEALDDSWKTLEERIAMVRNGKFFLLQRHVKNKVSLVFYILHKRSQIEERKVWKEKIITTLCICEVK